MHVTNTHPSGVVTSDTIFEFTQEEDVVSAKYTGGGIKLGYLIGKLEGKDLGVQLFSNSKERNLDGGYIQNAKCVKL
jgi:hypothetical protein